MLTWKELQKQAEFILQNKPTGDYEDISFRCRSGGPPANPLNLPEIHRSKERRYKAGDGSIAYAGEVVIRALFTGARDRRGRDIYEAETGQVFVYHYVPGDPCSFDHGLLQDPDL